MTIQTRDYADCTWIRQSFPWGVYLQAAALCADGKVRRTCRIAETADTFFSVPAAVRVKGKTVAGYITVETRSGLSTATKEDPTRVVFHAYRYRKNGELLP